MVGSTPSRVETPAEPLVVHVAEIEPVDESVVVEAEIVEASEPQPLVEPVETP